MNYEYKEISKIWIILLLIFLIVFCSYINLLATNKEEEYQNNVTENRDLAAFLDFQTNYYYLPYLSQSIGSIGEMQKVIFATQIQEYIIKKDDIAKEDIEFINVVNDLLYKSMNRTIEASQLANKTKSEIVKSYDIYVKYYLKAQENLTKANIINSGLDSMHLSLVVLSFSLVPLSIDESRNTNIIKNEKLIISFGILIIGLIIWFFGFLSCYMFIF